jgi:hypothetical protein
MPFWLHERRTTLWLKGFGLRTRVVATGVIGGGIVLSFLAGVYLPQQRSLQAQHTTYQDLVNAQRALAPVVAGYDGVVTQYNKKLAAVQQRQGAFNSSQHTMRSLVDLLHTCGMSCRGIRPRKVHETAGCQLQHFALNTKGSFKQLISFFNQLHAHAMPITCTSLSIAQKYRKRLMISMRMRSVNIQEVPA